MNELCIVGHGTSMRGSGRGEKIDQFQVARMKKAYQLCEQYPDDYGKRIDYACGTSAAIGNVASGFKKPKEYWVYAKSKYEAAMYPADTAMLDVKEIRGVPVVFPYRMHFEWLKKYFDFVGSDDLRFSTGMGVLLMALDQARFDRIILAGYDSLVDPGESHESVDWPDKSRKKYDWDNDPPHDYQAEHDFLYWNVLPYYKTDIEIME